MQIIGHLIVRLVVIGFGYILAVIAAAIFLSLGVVREVIAPTIEYNTGVPVDGFLVPVLGLIASPLLASALLGPAAILIAIAEWVRFQGLVTNVVLGGALAFFAGGLQLGYGNPTDLSNGVAVVLAAAGFIGGLVYWLIAGRSAGKWLDSDLRPAR